MRLICTCVDKSFPLVVLEYTLQQIMCDSIHVYQTEQLVLACMTCIVAILENMMFDLYDVVCTLMWCHVRLYKMVRLLVEIVTS